MKEYNGARSRPCNFKMQVDGLSPGHPFERRQLATSVAGYTATNRIAPSRMPLWTAKRSAVGLERLGQQSGDGFWLFQVRQVCHTTQHPMASVGQAVGQLLLPTNGTSRSPDATVVGA